MHLHTFAPHIYTYTHMCSTYVYRKYFVPREDRMVAHTCTPNTQETEARGAGAGRLLELQIEAFWG